MATIKTKRKRWPPNVGINNGNVRYRRQIPKDLGQVAGKRVYSEYLASIRCGFGHCSSSYFRIAKQCSVAVFTYHLSFTGISGGATFLKATSDLITLAARSKKKNLAIVGMMGRCFEPN
jgi:hypothetical protein